MVGVGGRDFAALKAWIGRLSVRTRIAGAMVLGFGAIVLVGAILDAQSQARLVSLEPNNTPTDVAMMRFALPRGRGLYQAHCASCHGVEGRGRPAIGAPNLTDNDWLYGEGQVSDIETVVQYGIRAPNGRTWRLADMPAFAHRVPYPRETALQPLTPGDIRDVVQFLDILRQQPADPAAALRGQAIFGNRGGCYDCHGRDGRGDAAIGAPNLTDSIWLYGDGSDAWIADTIANGLAGTCPAWFDRLSPAQIREISLYVYSLSHSGEQPKQSVP